MKHKKQESPAENPEAQQEQNVEAKPAQEVTSEDVQHLQNPQDTQEANSEADLRIAELTNDLQRTRADFENFRKQVDLQRMQTVALTKAETIEKFLPLIDDFDRALRAYPEQLDPLRKNFEKTLQTLGLAKINSEPDTEFNPDIHEAVSVEDGDGDNEVIVETLRSGYLYGDSVIRAAMVKVKRV